MISLPDPTGKLTLSTKLDEGLELCAAAPHSLSLGRLFRSRSLRSHLRRSRLDRSRLDPFPLGFPHCRYRVSVPLGVICVIFEARPDAAVQVSAVANPACPRLSVAPKYSQ